MKRIAFTLCLTAAVLLGSGRLSGWIAWWNNDEHLAIGEDLAVNDADFAEGAAFHEAIQDATAFWSDIIGTNYDLDHTTYNTGGLAVTIFGNGRNEIYRGSLPNGVAGRSTGPPLLSSHIEECDININNNPTDPNGLNLNWSLIAPSPANRVPLKLVVIHEMGHCAGLDHNDAQANMMATAFEVGDEGPWIGENFDAEPGEDERDWLRHIHGDGTVSHNLAMTTWALDTSAGGGGDPTNDEGVVIVPPFDPQGPFSVTFTFGYLNFGTEDETNVDVEYRIIPVSNPVWSAGTVIDTMVIAGVNSNAPFEITKIVQFNHPGDQCYFIGAFIDSTASIAESNESNNKVISEWTVCP